MKPPFFIALAVFCVVMLAALRYCRIPGRGGELGRRIRASDYAAWRDAVNEALDDIDRVERRIAAETSVNRLIDLEDERNNLRIRLADLSQVEPSL